MDLSQIYYETVRHIKESNPSLTIKNKNSTVKKQEKKNDLFILECKAIIKNTVQILHELRNNRRAYLSSDGIRQYSTNKGLKFMTNAEKDKIDIDARTVISKQFNEVETLQKAENERYINLKKKLEQGMGFFFTDPEAISRNEELHQCRNGVIYLVTTILSELSDYQVDMQNRRLKQEAEKNKSFSNKHIASTPELPVPIHITELEQENRNEEDQKIQQELSLTMIEELESENQDILAAFQDTTNQARAAEKSLLEIAALQSELAAHLLSQEQTVGTLLDDVDNVQVNIDSANKQLDKARRRNHTTARIVSAMSISIAILLLLFDILS